MPSRKRPMRDATPPLQVPELITSEPVLVGEARPSPKHSMPIYHAVDYLGMRFRLGDHVSMYTPDGAEWVCALEVLYRDADSGQAKFRGRWFWTMRDVLNLAKDAKDDAAPRRLRPSKCESHELIAGDNRDSNFVESISNKCCVLSYDNFALVKKVVLKSDAAGAFGGMGGGAAGAAGVGGSGGSGGGSSGSATTDKVFFCERQFYHRVFRFSELGSLLFPGDPIPSALAKAAGLPDPAASAVQLTEEDLEHAYFEPDVMSRAKKRGKVTKGQGRCEPIVLS